jgi:gas vesicle protein
MRRYALFALGAVLGSLVGSLVALLLAPSAGTELRGQINEKYIQISEDVRQATKQRRSELEDQLYKLRQPAAE